MLTNMPKAVNPSSEGAEGYKHTKPIIIERSAELIADEYEHFDNSKGLVHIFVGNESERGIKQTLLECGYTINDKHVHKIDNRKNVLATLKRISNENHREKSCLMIIFLADIVESDTRGYFSCSSEEKIELHEVWNYFIKWESFKGKPKIFLFQVMYKVKDEIVTDSFARKEMKYEVPVEADLFIAYKLISYNRDRHQEAFIDSICKRINTNGKRDDIVDIVTHAESDYNRALIISTLTRRFFITTSENRGYYHDIYNVSEKIEQSIISATNKLKQKNALSLEIPSSSQLFKTSMHGSCPTLEENMSPTRKDRRISIGDNKIRPRTNSNTKRKPWKP